MISDAKSLFDHLTRESAGGTMDRRVAMEMAVIKEPLLTLPANIRWVPHRRMLADGLTKIRRNSETLVETTRNGVYQLTAEEEELKHRREQREQGRPIGRPRRSGADAKT